MKGTLTNNFLKLGEVLAGALRKKFLDGGVGFRKRLLLGLEVVGERLNTFLWGTKVVEGVWVNSKRCLKWNCEGRRSFKHMGVGKGKNCLYGGIAQGGLSSFMNRGVHPILLG